MSKWRLRTDYNEEVVTSLLQPLEATWSIVNGRPTIVLTANYRDSTRGAGATYTHWDTCGCLNPTSR